MLCYPGIVWEPTRETCSHATRQGTFVHSRQVSLAESLWTDSGVSVDLVRASSSPLKKSRPGRNHRMFPQNPRLRGKGTIKIRLRHLYTEFGTVSISFAHYTSPEDFILYISDFYCVTPAVYFMKSVPLLCDKWRKSDCHFAYDTPEVFSFPVTHLPLTTAC